MEEQIYNSHRCLRKRNPSKPDSRRNYHSLRKLEENGGTARKPFGTRKDRKIIHWAGGAKPWQKPDHEGAVEWWEVARRTPYYEHVLYTNICAILLAEMNKKFTKLGKTFLERP